MFDYLIVGAGFSGAVLAERLATQLDKKVLLIEQRNHLGGNAYDSLDQHGIRIHNYGPHIFHTNSAEVHSYLSQFSGWRPYEHRVQAEVEGEMVPIPFNFAGLDTHWGSSSRLMKAALVREYGLSSSVPILKLRKSQDARLRELAEFVFEAVFNGYTRKMWGRSPAELDEAVLARVPVRVSYDDRYFTDTYQAMPADGYTRMFERMLNHRNIEVRLSTPLSQVHGSQPEYWSKHLIYTGPLDEYFGFKHGHLPYRTLEFQFAHFNQDQVQPVGTINYPSLAQDYTRETEFKHLTGQQARGTTLCREIPREHVPGKTEPYYPVPCKESEEIRTKYEVEVKRVSQNVTFCGRLADYRYYNMDQAVARALQVFERIANGRAATTATCF